MHWSVQVSPRLSAGAHLLVGREWRGPTCVADGAPSGTDARPVPAAGHSPEWDWPAYAKAFGHRLQRLRKERDLSQIDLAQRAGLAPNSVKLLELGRSSKDVDSEHRPGNPRLQTIYRLAEALGVAPAELLPGASDVPRPLPREAHVNLRRTEVGGRR